METMDRTQVSAILKECGLERDYVVERGPRDDRWRVKLNEDSDCNYGTLGRIAERFGTTDLRLSWSGEKRWSEHTSDPAEAWLEICDGKVGVRP